MLDWYRNADTKAQVLLTIDGAFLSFLTGAIFRKPEDLLPMTQRFHWSTWLLFALMCLTLSASIGARILYLWARIYSRRDIRRHFEHLRARPHDASTYVPEVMWYFQLVAHLDPEQFAQRMLTMSSVLETGALAHEIHEVAGNVA